MLIFFYYVFYPYVELAKNCSVKDCEKLVYSLGCCKTHYVLKWKKRNAEQVKIIQRRYYKKNKTKILERVKKYKKKNYDRVLKRQREYYAENRKRLASERLERYRKDPEKYSAVARKLSRKRRAKILRKKKIEFYDYGVDAALRELMV